MPYEFIVQNDEYFAAVGYSETVEEQQDALLQLTEYVLHHEVGAHMCGTDYTALRQSLPRMVDLLPQALEPGGKT